MRDRLFGYLLGALDPHEHEEVERLLGSDARMCEELELMRKALAPLECDKGLHEPPIGLAETTCRRVASLRVERVHPADRRAAVAVGGGEARPRRTLFGWSLVDLAVAAAILVAGGMLFFPAVNQSRFNAQVARCQNNLAKIGSALTSYSSQNGDTYPAIPTGHLSAAGMYAPQLVDKGLIAKEDKERIFRCRTSEPGRPEAAPIPMMEELRNATPDEAKKLLPLAGGSYGFTLGYKNENGVYQPTKRLGRVNFPIMSDAPCPKLGYQQSSNHGGFGQNVLYDDGHVRYTTTSHQIDGSTDPDFFHNDSGQVDSGNHANDAVIGCSAAKPVRESDE